MVALIAGLIGLVGTTAAGGVARPVGSSHYVVHPDPRLCPSPLCGGYWVALANRSRTRCSDGLLRPRCYVARAVDEESHPLEAGITDGALARADIEPWSFEGFGELGVLVVARTFPPAGRVAQTGSFVRLRDTGIRCVRAPCFSYRSTRLNGTSRASLSGVDLRASRASAVEIARADAALGTSSGLLARGRIVHEADGGRTFRASRLFLRSES